MFPGRKVVFISNDKDQIECLNFYLNTQGYKTYCDGKIIASWKTSYKNCLFKGAIFADDMDLTAVKWVSPSGYIQHTMSNIADAGRTELNPNSLSKFVKKMYANPFQQQQQQPLEGPQPPEQDQ